MKVSLRARRCGFLIALFVTLCGCGSSEYQKAAVTGTVTCNGKPAWGGVVVFTPVDAPGETGRASGSPGSVSLGKVDKDGSFRLIYQPRGGEKPSDGALTGPHQITFIPPMSEPRKWSSQDNWLPEEEKSKLRQEMAAEEVYPALECGIDVTPAKVEVQRGRNEFKFSLSETKKKQESRPKNRGGSD